MKTQKIIVAGIGTDTGKTVVSAILCKALAADYWKPVQAGDLDNTDSHKVKAWAPETIIHPEAYRLNTPMSPHGAADIDGITIDEKKLIVPETSNNLMIELAGGLMVPLRNDYLSIDWVASTGLPVILVADYYLGSINHTLLSLSAIKNQNIPLLGIVFNGEKNTSTFDVIMFRSGAKCLLEVDQEKEINQKIVEGYAKKIVI